MRMKGPHKVLLSKLGTLKKGGAILRDKLRPEGAAVILYGDIYTKYAEIVTNLVSRVDPSAVVDGVRLNEGDIVFAGSGETAEEIGKCIAYVGKEEAYAGGDVVILSNHGQDARYLGYALNAEDAIRQKMRLGQGSSVMHLYKDDVGSILIPLPPLAEQRKIAEILRTWDEAIETAEAELKAKQERKRWLMEKLLVGDWAVKNLDDLFELEGSGIDKVILQGEQIVPLVNYMDAYRKRILAPSDITAQTSVSPADLNRCKLKRGDIVLTPSSETPDDIAHSALIDFEPGDAVHSYHLFRLRARSDSAIVHDFRAFFLNHISVRKQFIRICSGTTRFTLTLPGVRGIKVSLPPVEHQEYAAAILGDATSQEALASQKIEALRAQKRGLMQKLLTGEVRVAA